MRPRPGRSLLDERRFAHSRALQLLAERLGCRDHEDLWERLFEAAPLPLEEHVARMAAYCRLARLDYTDDDLRVEGTLQREAEMASHVRAALDARKPGDGPVLVVVGGFHAVVLPDLLAGPPETPRPRDPARDGDQRRGADPVHLRAARPAQRVRRRHDLPRLAPAAVGAPVRGHAGPAAQRGHPGRACSTSPASCGASTRCPCRCRRSRRRTARPCSSPRCATARHRCAATCSTP